VRRALLALALLLAARSLPAEAAVRAEVGARKVGVEDQVELNLVVEGDTNLTEEPTLPTLRGLRLAGGPSVSTQLSFVNGAMSQRRVYTWVLQPTAAGKAEIGAFTVRLAGGDQSTTPIGIEVVAGSLRPPQPRANPLDPFGQDPFGGTLGRRQRGPAPKVLVKAVASRDRVHVGEPLLLTYYVYTQTTITNLRVADAPQYPGFWSEDLGQPEGGPRGEAATLDGERFERYPFLRRLLFPTRAGALKIPAATFHVGVARRSFFDVGDQNVTRSSDALEVNALPIPEEAGFSGAVGKFRATATLDKSAVALGEAATLRFRVEGSGNLKWIDKGPTVVVPGAKVYPPSTSSDLKPGPNGISGSKTWEFAIVPETGGTLEVPALSFAYFDPTAERLARAETPAQPITVQGGAPTSGAMPQTATAPARTSGVLPLRAELDPPAALLPRPSVRWLAWGLAAALLVHVALLAGPAVAERLRARSGHAAPRRTTRAALTEIERIGRDGMGKEAAAAALERALHDVFGPLENGGPAPAGERERAARAVLDDVRFLRYAPQLGDYSDKIREVASRAADLVRRWS
jgi:oxygen tolerance protein BatD